MSTYGEIMNLYKKLDILIRKMDKQIVLLEQMVEILTKIEVEASTKQKGARHERESC